MQAWFESLEKDLYSNKLTEEEKQEKIDAIAKAVETENHNQEEIATGLTNTLTNDTYFRKAIGDIDKYGQYVTAEEVVNYIRLLIEKKLPSCVLVRDEAMPTLYHFNIPLSQPKLLTSFLEENLPVGKGFDYEQMNRQFKSKVMGETSIAMTFDQDTAYKHTDYEFVNAYHPLVTAAYVCFEKNKASLDKTFSLEIRRAALKDVEAPISGEYFLGLYVLLSEKHLYGSVTTMELLRPVLFDIKNEVIVEDENLVKTIYAEAQDSSALSRRAHDQEDPEMILTMKIAMEEKVNQLRAEYIENESVLIEANKFTMVNQYTQYYDSRIEHLQNILRRHEAEGRKRLIPMAKKNVENMIIEKEEKLASIQDAGIVEKEHKLISLSRISIVD